MGRRRKSSTADDLMDLVALLLWWAGVALAAVSYWLLHGIATRPVLVVQTGRQITEALPSMMWQGLATGGQYLLPLSTDAGIDLVAYARGAREAQTIQVKSNRKSKPSGGKGKPALDWWMPENSPAQLVALVDLSTKGIWPLRKDELSALAQQRSSGRVHIYMYTDPEHKPKAQGRHAREFQTYRLENRANALFGA